MNAPQRFAALPDYAFPRLRALLDGVPAGSDDPVRMTIGDPRHAPPAFVGEVVARHSDAFMSYPANEGVPELRRAIAAWVGRRYGHALDPEREVMVLNGTREGLYNAAMALVPEEKGGRRPAILRQIPANFSVNFVRHEAS